MKQISNARGFTLIEVVAVLVILGIISAVIFSRGTASDEAAARSAAEALKSHIRFVQSRAMNMKSDASGCNASFGIRITTSDYFMFKDCDEDDKLILPGADSDEVSFPNVGFSAVDITFDEWGRPCNDLTGTNQTAVTVTLTSGGASETVTITNQTGFIP